MRGYGPCCETNPRLRTSTGPLPAYRSRPSAVRRRPARTTGPRPRKSAPISRSSSRTPGRCEAIGKYNRLRQLYPGKRIVIAEFGWPSAGYNQKSADPGRIEQAQVLRDFVARAEALGIDYNIVEAIDQPWKIEEGSVGPYWGMFDASRKAKFSWSGPVIHPEHSKLA